MRNSVVFCVELSLLIVVMLLSSYWACKTGRQLIELTRRHVACKNELALWKEMRKVRYATSEAKMIND